MVSQRGLPAETLPAASGSLKRGLAWTLLGSGVYLACHYATLIALARMTRPAVVGQYARALAIWMPIIVLSQLQLRQIQATDVHERFKFGDYLNLRLLTTALALLAVFIASLLWPSTQAAMLVIWMVGVGRAVESLSDLVYGRLLRRERRELIACSMAVRGLTGLGAFVLALWITGQLVWAVAAVAAAWAVQFVAMDLPLARAAGAGEIWTPPSWSTLRRLALFAAPLGVATGLQTLSASLPRYFVEAYHGKSNLALFAVAVAPPALITLMGGVTFETALPRAANYFQLGRFADFAWLALKTMLLSTAVGIALTAVAAAYGELILTVLFTTAYRSAAPIMVLAAAGATLANLGLVGSAVLSAGQMFRLQLLSIVVTVALQLCLCTLLVPAGGAVGAAWAELIKAGLGTVIVSLAAFVAYGRTLRSKSR